MEALHAGPLIRVHGRRDCIPYSRLICNTINRGPQVKSTALAFFYRPSSFMSSE